MRPSHLIAEIQKYHDLLLCLVGVAGTNKWLLGFLFRSHQISPFMHLHLAISSGNFIHRWAQTFGSLCNQASASAIVTSVRLLAFLAIRRPSRISFHAVVRPIPAHFANLSTDIAATSMGGFVIFCISIPLVWTSPVRRGGHIDLAGGGRSDPHLSRECFEKGDSRIDIA
jgi:hypothetical protein